MLQSSSKTAYLFICISFMLSPLVISAQQPADSLLLIDTATRTSLSDSSLATKKKKKGKKKNVISDTTNNNRATKAPDYTPYNSPPVQPSKVPERQPGAEILRNIINNKRKN